MSSALSPVPEIPRPPRFCVRYSLVFTRFTYPARVNVKLVGVLVELKARFDEEKYIQWGRKLEDEGVHVVYGVRGLKTHAKLCLIVRRESDGIRRYVHLGTGNYNVSTSRIYTDLSYFTSDPAIGNDVSDLFNALTGYSRKNAYARLLVAPSRMRQELLDRIDREAHRHRQHGDGQRFVSRHGTYGLFLPEMAQVGGPQSPESEVLSKAAYTDAWMLRSEFKSRYDSRTNAQYVNDLEANAEVTLSNKQ
jgi:hypothetical protein